MAESFELNSRISNSSEVRLFRAPGRVNLIGEHTDYNDGFVMPAAIDFCTWIKVSPRPDRMVSVFSWNFKELVEFSLDDSALAPRGHWSDYVTGVAVTLDRAGFKLRGADLEIRGTVPIGAGLSSSASIEVATGLALLANSAYAVNPVELARLCQSAENDFVGMRCGIMDQFISCHGQEGKALLLDCRSLEFKHLPLSADVRLLICNTMVKHELAGSEYNQRRAVCEAGVQHLAQRIPGVRALRDVTERDLELHASELPELVYRRCRHVISENTRVQKAAVALEQGDLDSLGTLMNESHLSLRDDYEVSCPELDLMVELARPLPGVFGARLTGGGFGGCTINLVKAAHTDEFRSTLTQRYLKVAGVAPEIYVSGAAAAAGEAIQ